MVFTILQRPNPLTFVIIPIAILGFWAPYILQPDIIMQYYDLHPMPLYKPLLDIFNNNHYIGLSILLGTIGINIFLLSYLNNSLRIIETRSSYFMLLYVLFSTLFIEFQQFSPLHFSLIWILLGLLSVFNMYKNEHELRKVFEAGMFFSIAGLFYINAFILAAIIFIGLIILLPFYWRQWLAAIFGMATPLFAVASWAFLFDKIPYLENIIIHNISYRNVDLSINTLQIGIFGYIALLLIASLLFTFSGVIKKVAIKKYYSLFFILLILAVLSYFINPASGVDSFFFIIVPVIFYITNYFLTMKIWIVPEFLSTLLIIAIIILQIL